MLSPLIFGFVSLVPSFITYSRKELSFRQSLVRKVLHVAVLEAMQIAFGFWAGILTGAAAAFSFSLTVFVVYLAANLISWQIDKKDAREINKILRFLQGRS